MSFEPRQDPPVWLAVMILLVVIVFSCLVSNLILMYFH